jgi:isopentenyl phosphate kinase
VSPQDNASHQKLPPLEPKPITLVKLGGSLITDKRREATPRLGVLAQLAREIAEVRPRMTEQLLVGHGSGSFGHMAAARSGLGKGPFTTPEEPAERGKLLGIARTQHEAARLHRMVIEFLLDAGEVPMSWSASAALTGRAGQPAANGQTTNLTQALELGMLPVIYGDVLFDHRWGAAIASTETLVRYLVNRLRPLKYVFGRLLWCGETEGVYDLAGRTIPEIDDSNYRKVLQQVGSAAGTDVTGGMALRLRTTRRLAQMGIESWILDGTVPGRLRAALLGEAVPCTRVLT